MTRKKLKTLPKRLAPPPSRYAGFSKIDGSHPYKNFVPNGYIDYRVHTRHDGQVFYFNFQLAIEMGLIPPDHPRLLNKPLINTLLHTFSIEIINEYDSQHNIHYPKNEIRPHRYMATRYLQLQHPNKQGATSGDGRSIWNGSFKGTNAIWDVSSCGTGATALSPAVAIEGRFFKTGDPDVSYGGGHAELVMGLSAAIHSEIFHDNGIETERTLAIIQYADGSAINVRAGKNLLRPAHLFRYLKQNDYAGLKACTDYYIKRQIENALWPKDLSPEENYRHLLREVCDTFAQLAAKFESEYIFCWLDWDGDNILMDGGIIDYGSIRQFGLFHRDYRYDDYDRMSTNILEQKRQAKYIVQSFAQAVDFLLSGKKKNIKRFRSDATVKDFDPIFKACKEKQLLYRMGFDTIQIDLIYKETDVQKALREFRKAFRYFERIQSSQGTYKITDGVTSDAVFCLRDLLRELPMRYLQDDGFVDDPDFIDILKSDYAEENDLRLYPSRRQKIRRYQQCYKQLIRLAAEYSGCTEKDILTKLAQRSARINRCERVTGDAIIHVTDKMLKVNRDFGADEMYRVFRNFIEAEILLPEHFEDQATRPLRIKNPESKKALQSMIKIVKRSRWGI